MLMTQDAFDSNLSICEVLSESFSSRRAKVKRVVVGARRPFLERVRCPRRGSGLRLVSGNECAI